MRAKAFLCPLDYLRTTPTILEGRANGRPRLDCYPFFFCFELLLNRFIAGSSHPSDAGLEDVLDESCGSDVEDELVPELDDNPWNEQRYEIVRFADDNLPIFGQPWLLTSDPWEYPWSSQSLPGDRSAGVSWRNYTVTNRFRSCTKTCASSWVCTSPLAVSTTDGPSQSIQFI